MDRVNVSYARAVPYRKSSAREAGHGVCVHHVWPECVDRLMDGPMCRRPVNVEQVES